MKTKTINVSIAGSCVCRDTFEIVKQYESFNQDAAKYLINMYIQSISFASAVAPKLEKSLTDALVEESEKSEKANFFKKMFKIDVEKNYFDYLGSVKSDWLIIDMTPSRFKLLKIGESYLSYDLAITIATGCKESTPDSAMSLIKSGEVVDLIDYDADVLVRMCTEWVNEIKQLFSQKKIIIVKTKNAKTFTDEGVLFSQNSYDSSLYKHDDKLFEIAYNCVEKQLPNAYVIEALPTLVGNVQHKWGRFGLHYVDEVYMYLFSCFDYIMNTNASRENKYAYMLKQNRIYAERIFEKYVNISNNSIQTARNILDTVKGIKIGISTTAPVTAIASIV